MTMDNRFSFKKGWKQLPQAKVPEARERIIKALGLQVSTSFYYRLYGKCEPKVSEAQAIEEIFHSYGITDIWGD